MLALEGMRGVAALMVFFVHFYALVGLPYTHPGSALRAVTYFAGVVGNLGVDIFFVISGFLMYGIVMRKPTPFLTYLERRVRRLYPVFLFVFVVYIVLSHVDPGESRIPHAPKQAAEYLLLNLAMLPGMLPIMPMIRVAWSLSYEWFYYLLLPFSVWAFRMRRWSPAWRIAFVLTVCLTQHVLCALHRSNNSRLVMFGAGAILWDLATYYGVAKHLGRRGELFTIALTIVALGWMGFSPKYHLAVIFAQDGIPSVNTPLVFVSFFALTLYSLFYSGILSRFFCLKWLRWVGNMSYSYYLVHSIALHLVARLMRYGFGVHPIGLPQFLVVGMMSLLMTLVAGAFLFLAIEKPLSLSLKPATAKNKPPAAVPAGSVHGANLQELEPLPRSSAD